MYKITEGKHTFIVECNKEDLLNQAHELMNQFEPNIYVAYGTSPEWGAPCFDETTYKQNVQKFIQDIDKQINEEAARHFVSIMPRKKNGKFAKNRVHEICFCENCQVLHEWHNAWIYYQVIVKAIDENTLEISLRDYTETSA